MNWALSWLLLGGVIALVPPATACGRPRTRKRGASKNSRIQAVVWVGGALCACVAVLGVRWGSVAACVACPGAVAAGRRLRASVPAVPIDASVALTLDLAAAALRAGRPLFDALERAAPAANADAGAALAQVAALLRLGAEPSRAWAAVPADSALAPVAAAATRSASSGSRIAAAFERAAAQIRGDLVAAAAARAHRAGVFAMAPLGLCFLPSFVCLGVVPVVVGLLESSVGHLP